MTLYLTVYHLNSILCSVELNKEWKISQQPKPISNKAIIQENTIFLPHFYDIAKSIGNPHASIAPISENQAHYTQIFKTTETKGVIEETKRSWLFFKEKARKIVNINKGDFFDLCYKYKGSTKCVIISGLFSIWVSNDLF